jgi:hypothetical protein
VLVELEGLTRWAKRRECVVLAGLKAKRPRRIGEGAMERVDAQVDRRNAHKEVGKRSSD